MSAAPRYPDLAGLRMSAEEYLALGETEGRYELIDGVIQMSPSPTPWHQILQRRLSAELDAAADRIPGLVAVPDVDLHLGPALVYEPDFVIYAPGRMPEIPERFTTPPDVVIQILSPGSRAKDLVTRRDDYDRFGVGEYWILDPTDGVLRVCRRVNGRFDATVWMADRIECPAIPGLSLDLTRLRAVIHRS